MSYGSIFQCTKDEAFLGRLEACCADEGRDAISERQRLTYVVASANDIESAYASALAADNPDPGGDESVITDAMILGVVQAHPPTDPTT